MADGHAPATLLNFAPMIDSEFCRFVLAHYGVPFVERRHIFPLMSAVSLFGGGWGGVPLCAGDGFRVVGPRPLVDCYDHICAADKKLLPADPVARAQVETDFSDFNGELGGLTAVLGYYYLLPHRAIMIEPFARGVPALEASLLRLAYPLVNALFTGLLNLSAEHAAQAFTQVQAIFRTVDDRIADGRHYLVGNTLSLADLALATAAAPILLPEFFGSPMPPFESMPEELKTIITELRAHPTARFVEAIYQKHRRG